MATVRSPAAMARRFRTDPTPAHQARHPLFPAKLAVGMESRMDPWAPIDLPVRTIDALNTLTQESIFPASLARSALMPGVVATHRDLQDSAYGADRVVLPVHGNELVFHLDSREKMLVQYLLYLTASLLFLGYRAPAG